MTDEVKDTSSPSDKLLSTGAEAYRRPDDSGLGDSPAERRARAEGNDTLIPSEGEDRLIDGDVIFEHAVESGQGGAQVEQPVPQPPRLDERSADDLATTGGGFVETKTAPAIEGEPITPNQALENAQAEIARLVAENLKLRRELEESEHEVNLYFSQFGPLSETT